MEKVYVIYNAELFQDWHLVKVFSSEEKAKEYLKDKPYTYGYFETERWRIQGGGS